MAEPVSWIKDAPLLEDYLTEEIRESVCRSDGSLHRLYQALGPWPSAIVPADAFYRAMLHAPDCPLELHDSEFVATFVAILNSCGYAQAHHGENFCATSDSREEAEAVLKLLEEGQLTSELLTERQRAMAIYTQKLTLDPAAMDEGDIDGLVAAGLGSDEIVHINQVAASFGYWTRMINGLGISLGAENVGLASNTLGAITGGQQAGAPEEGGDQ